MHSLTPTFTLTSAAAVMRMVWCGVLARFGFTREDFSIEAWIGGILGRLDDLLAQYRAGTLPPVAPARARTGGRGHGSQATHVLTLSEVAALLDAAPIAPCLDDEGLDAAISREAGGFAMGRRAARVMPWCGRMRGLRCLVGGESAVISQKLG